MSIQSAKLLYLIPTMKLSRTNCTVRSTFPFVWPRYDFMHQCYPLQKDNGRRHAWIEQTIQYIQFEGKRGTEMLAQAVAGLAAGLPDNAAVQEAAAALIQELGEYGGPEQADVQRKKPRHKKSQER